MAYSITPTNPDLDNAQVGTSATHTLLDETSDALHSHYARTGGLITSQGWPDAQIRSDGAKRTAARWVIPIPSDGPRGVRMRVHAEHQAGTGGTVYLESFATFIGAATDSDSYLFNAGVGTAELVNLTVDLPEGRDEAYIRMGVEGDGGDAADVVEVFRAGLRILPLSSVTAVASSGGVRLYGGGAFYPGRSTASTYPYPTSEYHAKGSTARGLLAVPRMLDAWSGVHGGASEDLTPRLHEPTRGDARHSLVPPVPFRPTPGAPTVVNCRFYAEGGASAVTFRPVVRELSGAFYARGPAITVNAAAAGAWYSSNVTLPRVSAPVRLLLDHGINGINPSDCAIGAYSAWCV